MRNEQPAESRPSREFSALELDPILGPYVREQREMENLRADPRVTEVMRCVRQVKDAAADGADATTFQQLYDNAKFAMDVFKLHTQARGNRALMFRAQIQLSLLRYELYKGTQEFRDKGLKTVPETTIYPLLVQIPAIGKLGQRNSATGQLEFSIDDVIRSLNQAASEHFDNAEKALKR